MTPTNPFDTVIETLRKIMKTPKRPLRLLEDADYTITNIHWGKGEWGKGEYRRTLYAELHDETGALVVASTLDYIQDKLSLTCPK